VETYEERRVADPRGLNGVKGWAVQGVQVDGEHWEGKRCTALAIPAHQSRGKQDSKSTRVRCGGFPEARARDPLGASSHRLKCNGFRPMRTAAKEAPQYVSTRSTCIIGAHLHDRCPDLAQGTNALPVTDGCRQELRDAVLDEAGPRVAEASTGVKVVARQSTPGCSQG
jgi:hypothetical protein